MFEATIFNAQALACLGFTYSAKCFLREPVPTRLPSVVLRRFSATHAVKEIYPQKSSIVELNQIPMGFRLASTTVLPNTDFPPKKRIKVSSSTILDLIRD